MLVITGITMTMIDVEATEQIEMEIVYFMNISWKVIADLKEAEMKRDMAK